MSGLQSDNKAGKSLGSRQSTGKLGEEAAAERLIEEGYTLLHRNWRCRSGELDIVARQGSVIVVVEVRARTTGGRFGTALESIDVRKQRQVRTTAEVYLQANRLFGVPVRFDVIAITIDRNTSCITEFRHIREAF
ncbi:YraN family protein [Paenibacillus sp. sptzw28]|uniref:YraN family protein n=1 Tax=Paenibacillus sp. sptzw28 TaxID=715179 RepID=UPI001C6E5EC9|nr:YraN family protein [Paenibacillus sp. sptzw28]QYR19792.1 YraN family protein [Paenibacillus sp. sptzw28]